MPTSSSRSLLRGRVTIVTGGASGVGARIARVFAGHGARVVIADVDERGCNQAAVALTAAGHQAHAVPTDVREGAQVAALVEATVHRFGRLDCAVNNAAVQPDSAEVADLQEAELDRVLAVNLTGVALCLKYELAQLRSQGTGGAIVNISSIRGIRPSVGNLAYVAAKHAVIGMTKVAAVENAAQGIRVNSVAPGAIDTPMLRGVLERRQVPMRDYARTRSVLGRVATPAEIAAACAWLCSDQALYVTAATLVVDGGYTVMSQPLS